MPTKKQIIIIGIAAGAGFVAGMVAGLALATKLGADKVQVSS